MSLVNNGRRSSTIIPRSDECRAWEISRDMLLMLQRDRVARQQLDPRYCERTLEMLWAHCQAIPGEAGAAGDSGGYHRWLFAQLSASERDRCIGFLKGKIELLRIAPGQRILQQGHEILPEEAAHRRGEMFGSGHPDADAHRRKGGEIQDGFYVLRSGFVEVTREVEGGPKQPVDLLRPGDHFGEIALLALHSDEVAGLLPGGPDSVGRRTATCRALDHVDLVYVPGRAFLELLDRFPSVARRMVDNALGLLARNVRTSRGPDPRFGEFLRQGLYQGRNLLVLDLDKCTRCQDCVRACSDSHDGVTRLVLAGERFDRYLVPSACRACHDPVCLNGCPVDAIHRRPDPDGMAIIIDRHCIGCGLCALNCPFGSIHMDAAPPGGRAELLATNCDLCASLDGNPRCVHSCPHDAARRLAGLDLAAAVGLRPPVGPTAP
jgi:Fe-S-cluster-containing hydrogenase component 2/CRP-like cAMP-binding protein